jgi:hypothetical protein
MKLKERRAIGNWQILVLARWLLLNEAKGNRWIRTVIFESANHFSCMKSLFLAALHVWELKCRISDSSGVSLRLAIPLKKHARRLLYFNASALT